MFSRWLNTGIKAAERALSEGRVDEAFARLLQEDTRNQRRIQELLPQLGRMLMARARVAAQAGHYRDAISDLDRLNQIGQSDAEAIAIRKRAEEELNLRVERHAGADEAIHRAADEIRAGRLESGRLTIDRLENPNKREQLREELDIRVQRSDQLIRQAQDALERDDPLAACRFWEEACQKHGRTARSDELALRLGSAVWKEIDGAFQAGRLERVRSGLEAAGMLSSFAPGIGELKRQLSLVAEAAGYLAGNQADRLREALLRLRSMSPDAGWIAIALDRVDRMLSAKADLASSPLGQVAPPQRIMSLSETVARPVVAAIPSRPLGESPRLFSGRLLLLVDGTGSGLLLANSSIRIGRAGAAVDLPLPADLLSNHAELVRDGDDYVLVSHGPATVNHRAVSRARLVDGDRIVLGGSAKMVFRKPSLKSDSAMLQLGDRCRMPQDVSFVVLFKGTCLLGPQASCHIRTREGDSRLVLFDRAGELFVRRAGRDGLPTGPAEALATGKTQDFGDIRLTLKVYEDKA